MVEGMKVSDLIAKCSKLKSSWGTRNKKIRDWYKMLRLTDELAQEGMESVASNDPRTGYNLAKHLMTSSIVAHRIPTDGLTAEEIAATSYMEDYVARRWASEETRYRHMGRQSLKSEVVGSMLATGWLCAFSIVEDDRITIEAWNPYEVFPSFGSDGMLECAHIYPLTAMEANMKVKAKGWKVSSPITRGTNLYDYWGHDDDGDIVNGIILGDQYVKELVKEPLLTKIGRFPLFISPVGGLPDRGAIDSKWQEHFGESMLATNEDLAKNYNRMLTFSQQLMRDTANCRWFEQSGGDSPILREEDMFKRGAIFRGAIGENVSPLPVPPIPVELRTMMMDYQNMIQRGLFPWAVFGNIQQQMSYLAMANVASAALQVLTPYMDAYRGLVTDIDNFWKDMMLIGNIKPYEFTKPKMLPKEFAFDTQADIEIPGYLVQRATVARMLNPDFRLSQDTVSDRLFPEIKSSLKEQAKVRKDLALMNPKAILVDGIRAYREQARLLSDAGDSEGARLYEKLATSMEAELAPQQAQQPRTARQTNTAEQSIMREVQPTQEMEEPNPGMAQM